MTVDKGKGERIVVRDVVYHGGMCPRCEGMGQVNDIDLSQLYDETKSLGEGAITVPGYTGEGWQAKIFEAAGLDLDKPIRKYTKKELHDFLYKESTKVKVNGINITYEGLVPRIQKSLLSKDVDAMQPHIRAFVERAGHVHHLSRLRWYTAQRGRTLLEDQEGQHRRGVRDADQRTRRVGARLDEPSVAPLVAQWGSRSTRLWRSDSATSASTGHRGRSRAENRSAPG